MNNSILYILDFFKIIKESDFMVIKILGSGCKNCITLEKNTKEALKEIGMEAEVVKVKDFKEIMDYGVMSTPALVVDERVVSAGRVLKPRDIINILENQR